MLTKFLAAGLIGSALLVSPVLAADTGAMNKVGTSTTAEAYHGDWRTSKVVGLSVYNNKDENIGAISDLLMDKSGNIKAVVVGVGGFLGMGEHLVAIPFEKIKFVDEPAKTASTTNTNPPAANPPNRPASSTTTGAATSSSTTTAKSNAWYPDHAMFDATKDELKNLPEFKYSS
ncbi:MAG TPA: PRC-barrel domain-containing protein [Bradyrhizobium sp.]|nr:PRC-barrel domain-containing protein [Bradyrhizobium sp.]